ncbi:hypothetical protein MCU_00756 [Bartonella elizabethae Re6043vi]|uniref:Uncharacterized protein n=2 Tax=Bartonella elizabethae TaxID=807 RepID=J0RD42_BAREL|nr:hypothetical protein MCU_00756 [Bartonella elizabethae Re6043vi]EJF96671.1 hypothetical protein MEE_00570 [Bartonella elizabethae F9251 = ATCC 49927]VEJ40100.1 Uncharacterised protein [Bartonella elizabethae]
MNIFYRRIYHKNSSHEISFGNIGQRGVQNYPIPPSYDRDSNA